MQKNKTQMLRTTACVIAFAVLGLQVRTTPGQTTEECKGMGYLCGTCYTLVQTQCDAEGLLIDEECDGEMVQGIVFDVTGTYVDYKPYPIGRQCHNNCGDLSECQAWYYWYCDGVRHDWVFPFYERDELLCGDQCFIAKNELEAPAGKMLAVAGDMSVPGRAVVAAVGDRR